MGINSPANVSHPAIIDDDGGMDEYVMSSDGAVYDIDDKSLADTMTTTKMGDARRGDFGRRRRRIRRDVHVKWTTSTTTFTVDVIAPPGGGEGSITVEMINDNVRRGGGASSSALVVDDRS